MAGAGVKWCCRLTVAGIRYFGTHSLSEFFFLVRRCLPWINVIHRVVDNVDKEQKDDYSKRKSFSKKVINFVE